MHIIHFINLQYTLHIIQFTCILYILYIQYNYTLYIGGYSTLWSYSNDCSMILLQWLLQWSCSNEFSLILIQWLLYDPDPMNTIWPRSNDYPMTLLQCLPRDHAPVTALWSCSNDVLWSCPNACSIILLKWLLYNPAQMTVL